jgi:hypothetical protein
MDIKPWSTLNINRRFRVTNHLLLKVKGYARQAVIRALFAICSMLVSCLAEDVGYMFLGTSVDLQRYIPEDRALHNLWYENLKPYIVTKTVQFRRSPCLFLESQSVGKMKQTPSPVSAY